MRTNVCRGLALGVLSALVGGACSVDSRTVAAQQTPWAPVGSGTPSPSMAPAVGGFAQGGAGSAAVPATPAATPVDNERPVNVAQPLSPQPPPGGGASGAGPGMQATSAEGQVGAEASPLDETEPVAGRTRAFLLFGQSNMWGVPLPQQQDLTPDARVEVLTTQQCAQHGNNQWVVAQPPLHGCVGAPGTNGQGPGVGPGDYFGKALADAFPLDTILLVPAAVPGVSINTFQPGQQSYTNLLNRARMAQERGEIAGMLFHHGESDTGQQDWPMRVKNTVDRLRSDLGIGEVPFVAGELLYSPAGCCGTAHNPLVGQLPSLITNAAFVSADGLTPVPASVDTFGNLHFDLASQRELGRRYAEIMIGALGS